MRLAIGDVHGRPFWKHYLNEDFSAFYFTGDYFDSHGSAGFGKQYKNFTEICAAARKDPRLKLCLGNHDYHYLSGVRDQYYSGFQEANAAKINQILEENIDLLKIVYVTEDNWIVSHAGVTNWFLTSLELSKPEEINGAFFKDRNILNFNGENIYGNDITQSPIWIRPGSLGWDALAGYSQIVGHTPVRTISEFEINGGKNKIALIDTHDTESIYRF